MIFVTVELPDGNVLVRVWTGLSRRAIKAAALEKYRPAKIKLGRTLWQNFYGAH